MPITPPRRTSDHPDYRLECEEALDLTVRALVDETIVAGWKPETVYEALGSLADNQRLAYNEDPDRADD